MTLDDNSTFYDVLDLKPDASPQEVREAYLRTKSAYNKDSVALYTLISTEEREDMIRKIEEAYDVLSNPDKRRDYDSHHGLLSPDEEFISRTPAPTRSKIISIDRVPPMDASPETEGLLVPPSTDFSAELARAKGPAPAAAATPVSHSVPESTPAANTPAPQPAAPLAPPAGQEPAAPPAASATRSAAPSVESALAQDIAQEIEWKGSFLRRVREARRMSIEEVASITKITKSYIVAIEEENYPKLPAAVYLRGFLVQISKALKLPHEKVATAFMARYYQARPDQAR